jgi:Ni,Fe-hydrogenase III large subunit/Ni,Fe-hydrogenase III component G
MTASSEREKLQKLCTSYGRELYRWIPNQVHCLVKDSHLFIELGKELRQLEYYLVALFANDERDLEDHSFKLYYIFSHSQDDLFLVLEFVISPGSETFPSLMEIFPSVASFESEIADMYGLVSDTKNANSVRGSYLHSCYPPDFFPLRRDHSGLEMQQELDNFEPGPNDVPHEVRRPPEGEVFLPVGPIHAGVIEPGHFLFRIGSETIENLEIHLGYTHRGIERLFQSGFTLRDGWQLAEHVSGDSSFAHSLAYCHAVEAMASVSVPYEAILLRSVFLELERIANHLGDSALLVHDLALDIVAMELAVLRENVMRICKNLSGSRFLRGANRPGGIVLPQPIQPASFLDALDDAAGQYLNIARMLVELDDFRERTVNVGILPQPTASQIGITGIIARASGINRDFRVQHPFGIYTGSESQTLLSNLLDEKALYPVLYQPLTGDVFSRFLVRVQEVYLSIQLIKSFVSKWTPTNQREFCQEIDFSRVPNFEFGFGYCEGWRGDIVYWIMKDKFEDIFRCKVRDPSILNWPGIKVAVDPHWVNDQWAETTVVDFPIINKSFNLSYAGNDL